MPGTQLPNNDEELDAAMALAALVSGDMADRSWRDERSADCQRGEGDEKGSEGISWSLRRRRSGSVIVVNEKGSPLTELSSKLAKMQKWEEKQRQGGRSEGEKHPHSSNELSQSGLSEAGNSDGSGSAGGGQSSLIPGVDQAKVERAFEQGLEGIAQLLKEDRPLIRAPSFPPQLSVNTLLPQLSIASQSGLQTELSLGLQSQRSNVGELQSQLSAPSAFLAAIAASLPPSASQPWPSYHQTFTNPITSPLSNPITRTDSYQYTESLLAQESDRNALESPKLVDFLSAAGGPSEGDDALQERLERGNSDSGSGLLRDVKQETQGLGFGDAMRRRLARVRRRKAAAGEIEEADPSKEAQRLRRIQANRESARKTIMRKQAVCKQLSMEAQELGDENLDLRSKVEAAQKELEFLVSEQAKLRAELSAARTEFSDKPSDAHPSVAAPVLPDLSDDRKSTEGLTRSGQGLANPPPNPDAAPEAPGVERAGSETERKKGSANPDQGLDNQGAAVGDRFKTGQEARKFDLDIPAYSGGLKTGLGLGGSANPEAKARSGKGSTGELSLLNGPRTEPLSKRGSDESVTADASCPPRRTNSTKSAFFMALGGSVSGQPTSHVGPPGGEILEQPLQGGGPDALTRGPLGNESGDRPFFGGITERERLTAEGGLKDSGAAGAAVGQADSARKGSLKGSGFAGADVGQAGSAREGFSGLLPDVSVTLGGDEAGGIGRSEGVLDVRNIRPGGGSDHPGDHPPGREQSGKVEDPRLLSLLHTLATESGPNSPETKRDDEIDFGLRRGLSTGADTSGGAGEMSTANEGLVENVVQTGLVCGLGQDGVHEAGSKPLAHAHSLPPFPWMVSQTEPGLQTQSGLADISLQRQLSAPMPVSYPSDKPGLRFLNLQPKPAVHNQGSTNPSEGASYAPPEAGVSGQAANPNPKRLTQKASPNARGQRVPDAEKGRGDLDGIAGEPRVLGLTRRLTPDGPALSLGSASWRMGEGVATQPSMGGFAMQPSLGGVATQPNLGGFATQPSLGGIVSQPSLGGVVMQPFLAGVATQPSLGGVRFLGGRDSIAPLQNVGSQSLPGPPWAGTWDGIERGGSIPGTQWPPSGSGPGPAQGMELSLGLQMAAPVRTVKPETGVYNVYRGAGRRGSVSLHIGPLPVVDAVTAAEARKRRREVTKSKFGVSSGGASGKVQKVKSAKGVR